MAVVEPTFKREVQRLFMSQFTREFYHCLRTLHSIQHTTTSEFILIKRVILQFQGRVHSLHFISYTTHNNRGILHTTVAEEKKYNPRLTKTIDEFIDIMNNLNLAYPKQIGKNWLWNIKTWWRFAFLEIGVIIILNAIQCSHQYKHALHNDKRRLGERVPVYCYPFPFSLFSKLIYILQCLVMWKGGSFSIVKRGLVGLL